ncbi:hypothetical protein R16034_00797 [Ralstonia edaphis]|uniref:Uncharacterized protein n=1 Tax=Ralstonia edaphi TaxID=3058599 RepID=A0AB72X3L4_9RALS|nr:hypothetical protein [Ralstonia sp. LMG 6871]CAJ0737643.1 hypothetical protein R16034_00797 [Ralstonia sp. LMG 6871]
MQKLRLMIGESTPISADLGEDWASVKVTISTANGEQETTVHRRPDGTFGFSLASYGGGGGPLSAHGAIGGAGGAAAGNPSAS